MAEDHREPQERPGGLPRRIPGALGRTPGQVRRGYLPVSPPDPAAAAAPAVPDAIPEPDPVPELATPIAPAPSPTAMASSAAKLLGATPESDRTALTSAAAQELANLTRQRVVPLQSPASPPQARAPGSAPLPAGPAAVPPATVLPAAVPPAAVPPIAVPRRRARSARRWQLTGMLLALALVAGSVAIALATRHSPAASARRSTPGSGSRQIGAASVIRGQAAAWVASQVARNIEIACDAATCSDLAQHGFPAGNLNVLQPTAPDPYGSELVIATAGVRSQFGSKLATVYAPEVIASFGTGADRIDVRVVAANGPAAFASALQADLRARRSSGAELLRNRRIITSATDRAQLRAGQVDLRLVTTLAFMAGQQHLKVVDFGSTAPGASPGVPLRFADLAETDPAARLKSAAYVRSLLTLVRAEQPPYVPLSAGSVRLSTGQTVLRIEFAAPSPLGLLSS
jgi:hypothetical protein